MAVLTHSITEAERARRTKIYQGALASVRLEGLEPDDETKALYARYMDGELTLAEVGRAINELNDRDFGPISVSGHECPKEPSQDY
jgi:hypothetical protein